MPTPPKPAAPIAGISPAPTHSPTHATTPAPARPIPTARPSKPDWVSKSVRRPTAPASANGAPGSPGADDKPGRAVPEGPLMRVATMAAMLDVSTKRAYNLLADGRIETVNLGKRQTRVVRASFELYLKALLEGPYRR